METKQLLNHLRKLEIDLHQSEVRKNLDRLNELLHAEFVEIGRSGNIYSRIEILELLQKEAGTVFIWSQDYTLSEMITGFVQITYRSAKLDVSGELSGHTLRSSIWQFTSGKWQMRFHQGTPTSAFPKKHKLTKQ